MLWDAYDFDHVVHVPNLEGYRTVEELVCKDSDAPNVYFAVIGTLANDFWWRINRRSALSVPQERGMDGPAEIADLYCVFMQEDVLRLEVAMQDIIGVHVLHSCTDLTDPFFNCLLWYLSSFLQVLVKIFPQAWLKDQIR